MGTHAIPLDTAGVVGCRLAAHRAGRSPIPAPKCGLPEIEEANMSQRGTALARLHEELSNIEVFDRLHDYAPNANPASERAYANRQVRRKQIQDEITRLSSSESKAGKPAWVGSAVVSVVFLCAIGYAVFHFLLNAQSTSIHLSRVIVR